MSNVSEAVAESGALCSARTVLPAEFNGSVFEFEARAYGTEGNGREALVLIRRGGSEASEDKVLVHIHAGCITGDIFRSRNCTCHHELQNALASLVATELGVLIYLPRYQRRGAICRGSVFEAAASGDYDLASRILVDLGFSQIRLATRPGAGMDQIRLDSITITEFVPLSRVAPPGTGSDSSVDVGQSI